MNGSTRDDSETAKTPQVVRVSRISAQWTDLWGLDTPQVYRVCRIPAQWTDLWGFGRPLWSMGHEDSDVKRSGDHTQQVWLSSEARDLMNWIQHRAVQGRGACMCFVH